MYVVSIMEARTGYVRVSGYAIKLRRVINATLSDYFKKGELDSSKVNEKISEVNSELFKVIVEDLKIPKEAIVNITLSFEPDKDKGLKVNGISIHVFEENKNLSDKATEAAKKVLL